MPATSCATCSSTSSTTTTSSQQQTASKVDTVKPIGICVAPGLQSTACSSNKFQSGVQSNYLNSGTTTGLTTGTATLQSLGLMVTRFASDPTSRHQTVILHPRPVNPPNRAANASSMTAPGGQSSAAALRTVTTVPLGNATVRGQQSQQTVSQPSTIQVMNLSVSNPTSNAAQSHQQQTVKQFCPPSGRFNMSTLPLESLELVVTNDSSSRPIRLHSDINIVNVKPSNSSTSLHHNVAKLTRASVVTSQQPAKMINIQGTSGVGAGPQVARLGIIGQIPSVPTTVSGNKPASLINSLTLTTKPLQILNPSSSVTPNIVNSGGTTVHSVVSVSNVTSFPGVAISAQNQHKTNPTLMTLSTTAGQTQARHALITSNCGVALSQQSKTSTTSTTSITSSALTVQHYNQQHLSLSAPLSTTTSTSLRPNILSSPANSPVKQNQVQQQSTPSSPRPSILIRKRVANEINTVTNNFRPAFTTSSTPTRIVSVTSSEALKAFGNNSSEQKDETNKGLDSLAKAAPSTPNSDATGATPRKKPRKQLLEPFNLTTSQNIKLLSSIDESKEKKEEREFVENKEGIITICKKPRPSLLTPYNVGCKSLQYHFLRYSDVRQKSEKKLTLSELSHEGLQRKNGWKIHHLGTQMEDVSDNEAMVYERLTEFLHKFERNGDSLPNNITVVGVTTVNSSRTPAQVSVVDKLSDLIRGNLQRSNLFQEQICESKQLLVKLTNDHKERVAKLTKKCANKRTYITK